MPKAELMTRTVDDFNPKLLNSLIKYLVYEKILFSGRSLIDK